MLDFARVQLTDRPVFIFKLLLLSFNNCRDDQISLLGFVSPLISSSATDVYCKFIPNS